MESLERTIRNENEIENGKDHPATVATVATAATAAAATTATTTSTTHPLSIQREADTHHDDDKEMEILEPDHHNHHKKQKHAVGGVAEAAQAPVAAPVEGGFGSMTSTPSTPSTPSATSATSTRNEERWRKYFTVKPIPFVTSNKHPEAAVEKSSSSITTSTSTIASTSTSTSSSSYLGCLASCEIPKHTLIHQEAPLLQGHEIWTAKECRELGLHKSQADDDYYLEVVLKRSKEQRHQFWQLHDQRAAPAPTPAPASSTTATTTATTAMTAAGEKRLMGIVLSNGFCNSDVGYEPTLFGGVTSRFNHSCRPNVGMDFAGSQIRLFTTRTILPMEELCLCYNDVAFHHSARVRRAFLTHKYHFDCYCPACALSVVMTTTMCATSTTAAATAAAAAAGDDTASVKSDGRRRRIARLAHYVTTQLAATSCAVSFMYNDPFEQEIHKVQTEDYPPSNDDGIDDDDDDDSGDRDNDVDVDDALVHSLLTSNHASSDTSRSSNNTAPTPNSTMEQLLLAKVLSRLMEYMNLLQQEGIDHDMLECSELAYDLSVAISSSSSSSSSSSTDTKAAAAAAAAATTEWAIQTLALYNVHKGSHHTATHRFRLKMQSDNSNHHNYIKNR